MFEVTIEETFSAGHALRNYHGKCENPHGHNYRCELSVAGAELDAAGLLVDFVELKRALHEVLDRLDHQWLNDITPFDGINPSAENIARHVYDEVAGKLADKTGARVSFVRLWETDTARATYFP